MTKEEFEWAWNQSPSPAVAELFLLPDTIVKVERPMDRRWHYKGLIPGSYCDWMIPCPCLRPKLVDWYEKPPEIRKMRESVVCCRGVHYHGPKLDGWLYVGVCPECGNAYWLEKVRGT